MSNVLFALQRNAVFHGRFLNVIQRQRNVRYNLTSNVTCRRYLALNRNRFLSENITNERKLLSAFNFKLFCTKPNANNDDDNLAGSSGETDEYQAPTQLPATVAVPEVWPHLPVIATRRNPVFPRFMKIIEVIFTKNIFYLHS